MGSICKFRNGWRAYLYTPQGRTSKLFKERDDADRWIREKEHAARQEEIYAAQSLWTPPAMVPLRQEDLKRLLEVTPAAAFSGVYFLWDGERLVYVGQSRNIAKRVATHYRNPPAPFSRATYLSVPHPWQLAIEQIYLEAYVPEMMRAVSARLHGVNNGMYRVDSPTTAA